MNIKKLIRDLKGVKKSYEESGDADFAMTELDEIIKDLKIAEKNSGFDSQLFARSIHKKQ